MTFDSLSITKTQRILESENCWLRSQELISRLRARVTAAAQKRSIRMPELYCQ